MFQSRFAKISSVLLLLAIALIVYLFLKLQGEESDRKSISTDLATTTMLLETHQKLLGFDRLLMDKNWEKARAQYKKFAEQLKTDDSPLLSAVEERIALMDYLSIISDSVRVVMTDIPRDQIPGGLQNEVDESNQNTASEHAAELLIDSLTFALEKAGLEAQNLRTRLTRNTSGNYLTFKSTKGNEVYYVGDVSNGKAFGRGVGILGTGSRYEGEWKDNKKEGIGIFYWLDGASYEGSYLNDLRHGEGTYLWPNGEKFVGEWREDLRNGKGTFYSEDGKVVAAGQWVNDELTEEQ